jgi:hypothetical protein
MLDPTEELTLSMSQNFEIERMNRAIDNERDIEKLRSLTKQLLKAWHCQKAATTWVMSHKLPAPFRLESESNDA